MARKRYTVEVKPKARKAIRRFPWHIQERVDRAIIGFADDPWPAEYSCKKVGPKPPTWRIKIGADHRIIYTVDTKAKHIEVFKISTREGAY